MYPFLMTVKKLRPQHRLALFCSFQAFAGLQRSSVKEKPITIVSCVLQAQTFHTKSPLLSQQIQLIFHFEERQKPCHLSVSGNSEGCIYGYWKNKETHCLFLAKSFRCCSGVQHTYIKQSTLKPHGSY